MITYLAHVCFTVSNLEKSVEFYCRGLGLNLAFDFVNQEGHRFGVYINVGGRNFIELFEGQIKGPVEGGSFRHFCLEVDNIWDMVKELKAKNIQVSEIKLGSDKSYQAWLADPDGNQIELHCYTPESKQTEWLKSSDREEADD